MAANLGLSRLVPNVAGLIESNKSSYSDELKLTPLVVNAMRPSIHISDEAKTTLRQNLLSVNLPYFYGLCIFHCSPDITHAIRVLRPSHCYFWVMFIQRLAFDNADFHLPPPNGFLHGLF